MKIVECRNLTKTIGGFNALDQLNVSITGNKMIGLIGRNGAGKTTLMKVLAGYWRETSGKVEVFAERPFQNLFVSANAIYVDDQMEFSPVLTLEDILVEAARFYPSWDKVLADRLFDYFNFHPRLKHGALSKGRRSTFNMIIGLAAKCQLTMFDEPTTGMDASVRKDFYRALLKDYLAHPRTIIVSSHHLEEVEDILEEIIFIDEGKVFLHEAMDDLKEYAKGVTGNSEILDPILAEHEVIYQTQVGMHNTYAVVQSSSPVIYRAEKLGFAIGPVAPNDLCIYLTAKHNGGIDDVFK